MNNDNWSLVFGSISGGDNPTYAPLRVNENGVIIVELNYETSSILSYGVDDDGNEAPLSVTPHGTDDDPIVVTFNAENPLAVDITSSITLPVSIQGPLPLPVGVVGQVEVVPGATFPVTISGPDPLTVEELFRVPFAYTIQFDVGATPVDQVCAIMRQSVANNFRVTGVSIVCRVGAGDGNWPDMLNIYGQLVPVAQVNLLDNVTVNTRTRQALNSAAGPTALTDAEINAGTKNLTPVDGVVFNELVPGVLFDSIDGQGYYYSVFVDLNEKNVLLAAGGVGNRGLVVACRGGFGSNVIEAEGCGVTVTYYGYEV